MRKFKYNVYITILSTDKTYIFFSTLEWHFEMAVSHHRWKGCTGHIPAINGLFLMHGIAGQQRFCKMAAATNASVVISDQYNLNKCDLSVLE
jgi:hypothetical protein